MEILKEWFFADDPPAGYGRKISDTMFLVEAGGTVTTQVSLKQIPIVIIIHNSTESRSVSSVLGIAIIELIVT